MLCIIRQIINITFIKLADIDKSNKLVKLGRNQLIAIAPTKAECNLPLIFRRC